MLKDGKFVKEDPVKIGVHYAPNMQKRKATPEECFIQDIFLGINPYTTSVIDKIIGKVLSI